MKTNKGAIEDTFLIIFVLIAIAFAGLAILYMLSLDQHPCTYFRDRPVNEVPSRCLQNGVK